MARKHTIQLSWRAIWPSTLYSLKEHDVQTSTFRTENIVKPLYVQLFTLNIIHLDLMYVFVSCLDSIAWK